MDLVNKSKYNIILGSGSSRRKELLGMTGINFSVMSIPVDESFPDSLQGTEISEYIFKNKSKASKNYQNPQKHSCFRIFLALVPL